MNDQKEIVKLPDDQVPALAPYYGSREELTHLAGVIRTIVPDGDKFTVADAMTTALAAVHSDANLARGDMYAYIDHRTGKLVTVDGYKLLVREAKLQEDYREIFFELTAQERDENNVEAEDIAVWVYVLRDSKYQAYLEEMRFYKAEFDVSLSEARQESLKTNAQRGLGLVKKSEMWSKRYNKPIPPPKTMTWPEVAIKRGVKHAIRRAYRLPSPSEIMARRMNVDGTQTEPEDWANAEQYKTEGERRQAAKVNAWHREHQEQFNRLSPEERQAEFEHNVSVMRGDDDDYDPVEDAEYREMEAQAQPEPEHPPAPEQPPEPSPEPSAPAQSEPPNGKKMLTVSELADRALAKVNEQTDGYYDNIHHLKGAWKKMSGSARWPAAKDAEAWVELIGLLTNYAHEQRQVAQEPGAAEAVLEDHFGEVDAEAREAAFAK